MGWMEKVRWTSEGGTGARRNSVSSPLPGLRSEGASNHYHISTPNHQQGHFILINAAFHVYALAGTVNR